ncbi:hypothetical protein Celaphus_00010525 [Cervus elaphus hippelaphus]|uniref:Uncharacterized protein n=1 Tax=Cervus elaphus hippelaphus TaxID=46360 RepID=A0A212C8S7_CEREH|nr:hypothetical protein Celaphus_00010525 [Cervus elaphus hippelaphus]
MATSCRERGRSERARRARAGSKTKPRARIGVGGWWPLSSSRLHPRARTRPWTTLLSRATLCLGHRCTARPETRDSGAGEGVGVGGGVRQLDQSRTPGALGALAPAALDAMSC